MDRQVHTLKPGDRLLSLLGTPAEVLRVEPAGFTAASKWTGDDVPVYEVEVRSAFGTERTHFWNADRRVQVENL